MRTLETVTALFLLAALALSWTSIIRDFFDRRKIRKKERMTLHFDWPIEAWRAFEASEDCQKMNAYINALRDEYCGRAVECQGGPS